MIEFLNEEKVRQLVTIGDLIPAMEEALTAFSAGRVDQPVRQFVGIEEFGGFFALMPAVGNDIGVKLATLFPGNPDKGLPTVHALIVLFDRETGQPSAVMDGHLITELRTAAVSAVATRLLAPADAQVLGILGSGAQARSHVEALRLVRDFAEIRVWSRDPAHAEAFAAEVGATAVAGAEEAVRGADVVVTATGAETPILRGDWLKSGAHVNAVGWNGVDSRELDDTAMGNVVFVESREAAADQAGNVRGSGCAIHAELGQALAGEVETRAEETTIFDSVGMAIEDVAAAGIVSRKLAGG